MQIDQVFIQPDFRRKRVAVTVHGPAQAKVRLAIADTTFSVAGESGVPIFLDFPEFTPWTSATPQCYTLHARLLPEDGPPGELTCTFGMREFTVKDQQFHLNSRPFRLRGVQWHLTAEQSLEPQRVERALEMARAAGFNALFLRPEQDCAAILEQADALGVPLILVLPDAARLRAGAWQELFLAHRNHPALVAWYLEGAGQADAEAFARELHAQDAGRLLLAGGKAGTGLLYRPFRSEPEPFGAFHVELLAPHGIEAEHLLAQAAAPQVLNLFFASGPGALPARGEAAAPENALEESLAAGLQERQLERALGAWQQLAAPAQETQARALCQTVQALQRNPALGGYSLGALLDCDPAGIAGLLAHDGQPKLAIKALAGVQRPVRPIIYLPKSNLAPREEAEVTVYFANEHKLEGRADLSLQVIGPTNQVLWKKKRGVKVPRDGRELWQGAIAASGSTGVHRFVVRLLQGTQMIAEDSATFQVIEPTEAADVGFHVLDPRDEWFPRLKRLAQPEALTAPVHIIPPLAHTLRAYPEDELLQLLAQVRGGAVALFFSPPADWNELAERLDPNLRIDSEPLPGGGGLTLHYVKLHPVFEGLPNRCIMRDPYRNVAPRRLLLGASDEDICGAFAASNGQARWAPGIVMRRYGSGRMIFTHLRVLEHLGSDPLADRLFVNMLGHFSRRSVPAETALPMDARATEWLREAKAHQVRRWMVLGPFSNLPQGGGHPRAYAPEERVQLEAPAQGWHGPVSWRNWFSLASEDHTLDLRAALDEAAGLRDDLPRTVYAYAEFLCDRRQDARLRARCAGMVKCWLNGAQLLDNVPTDLEEQTAEAECLLRQGRNTLLLKCSGAGEELRCSLELLPALRLPLSLTWWK